MKAQASFSRLVSSTLLATTKTGMSRAPQEGGHLLVLLGDADRDVHDHDHGVGVLDGPHALAADLGVETLVGGDEAAGVHDHEGPAPPLGVDGLAVAGDPGPLLDDGLAAADDAVEEGRLAHVGPSDDGDHRRAHQAATGSRAARRDEAVGGDDLDGPGQVLGGGPVQEAPAGQADVGQQVAMARRLVGQDPLEVLAHQQAGHPDVAAEEPVLDRQHPDVVPLGQEGAQDLRAVACR